MINILKGDMAIVGPRPLLVKYLPYYTEEEKHRHDVRPGLTGLAQICGRNNLDWNERFEMDLKYVNSISFKEDLIIIFKTISSVLKHNDIEVPRESHDLDAIRKIKGEEKDEYINN